MNWTALFAKAFDAYDMKARLFPGLLVLLPAIVYLGLTYGAKHPALAALGSIIGVCGGPYALAAFVRTWGQRAQTNLYMRWGGQPSTILLRHSDARIATQTKQAYHAQIALKLGLKMPSAEEEENDPVSADQAYAAAADALRPMTNNKVTFPFVFKELVAYGYNRNAFGARWVGMLVALSCAVVVFIRSGALSLQSLAFDMKPLFALSLSDGLTLIVCALLSLLWLFHFTGKTVEQSGFSYALRLLEALHKVPRKPGRSAPRT